VPYRITAVCLGNICRSPIAEAVLRDRVIEAGLDGDVIVDSAGTGDWHLGHGADLRSLATLASAGYDFTGHRARQINREWFADLDLILAMDSANYVDLQAMAKLAGVTPDLHMLRSFDPSLSGIAAPDLQLDVPDPYYGGDDGFTDVLDMIERSVDGLITQLPAHLGR
jgi:protein-tyrosine phosphatase